LKIWKARIWDDGHHLVLAITKYYKARDWIIAMKIAKAIFDMVGMPGNIELKRPFRRWRDKVSG